MKCVLAILDGNWNNRTNAGLSYWNLNNTSSNSNINIGRQTLIRKESYWGWLKHSDSYNFYNKNVRPKVSIETAKRRISEHAK